MARKSLACFSQRRTESMGTPVTVTDAGRAMARPVGIPPDWVDPAPPGTRTSTGEYTGRRTARYNRKRTLRLAQHLRPGLSPEEALREAAATV